MCAIYSTVVLLRTTQIGCALSQLPLLGNRNPQFPKNSHGIMKYTNNKTLRDTCPLTWVGGAQCHGKVDRFSHMLETGMLQHKLQQANVKTQNKINWMRTACVRGLLGHSITE